ncbi:response regulator transcription factor [Nocardiaceae bacterium YC2-7]|uniref:Response regulator transcription factor n=1 Tax=Antrihabitans stalactiti TaxID=2584121 RepID=A0A848KHS3_9NOCA|nr:response regulator transcription factor [Antrihabitans stalactiti]NMN96252.1 response regulator transcription factor [Antrihabitans stalactiti]
MCRNDISLNIVHILVADDDPVVREVVRRYLQRDGMTVIEAVDGPQAMAALAGSNRGGTHIDLAVLDVMMPEPDGIAICARMRTEFKSNVPIILLTALGDEDDRVLGLQAGADDYVTKPFSPRELALRVASVLRRSSQRPTADNRTLRDGAIEVRVDAQAALINGSPVDLTAREFDLLAFFLAHPRRVYTREELLEHVWGWTFGDLSTVTVHIKRLRAKLGDHHRIDTVWGRGYAWARTDPDGGGADAD